MGTEMVRAWSPARQLLLEHPILLDQVLDGSLLVAVDPASDGREEHLQRVGVGPHALILSRHNSHFPMALG